MNDAVAPARATVSRRRVIAGLAWSVPVIATMSATPAFAASPSAPPSSVVLVWDNLGIWQADGRRVTGNFGIRLKDPGQAGTANVVLKLYRASNNQLIETLNVNGIPVSQIDAQRTYTFSTQLIVGQSYYVIAVGTGTLTKWKLGGQPEHTGSWTLAPITATSNRRTIDNW